MFSSVSVLSLLSLVSVGFSGEAPPVPFGVYYESCCPYSQAFIVGSFTEAWSTPGFTDMTTFIFSPWGHETYNQSSNGQYNYYCQHGYWECIGQRITACVIMLYPNPLIYIPFIINLETQLYSINCNGAVNNTCCDPTSYAQKAADSVSMNWLSIEQCAYSDMGDTAILQQYATTMKLNPPLSSVPWLTLNDSHELAEDMNCESNALGCVCSVYSGDNEACST